MRGRLIVLVLTLVFLFFSLPWVRAASSDYIHFQSKLTNLDGTNVTDGTYYFKFQIYDAPSGGTLLWEEEQSVSVNDGILNVELGSVTAFPAGLFRNSDLYLHVWMDNNGNTSDGYEEDFGRMPLGSVPYAFYAREAGALVDGTDVFEPGDFLKVRDDNVWNPDQNLSFFRFKGNTTDPALYIDAVQNRVGINTDIPSSALHVVGKTISTTFQTAVGGTSNQIMLSAAYGSLNRAHNIFTQYSSGGIGIANWMYLEPGSTDPNTWYSAYSAGSIARSAILLKLGDFMVLTAPSQNVAEGDPLTTQPTTKFIVKNNGNVGIGTSSPVVKLDTRGWANIGPDATNSLTTLYVRDTSRINQAIFSSDTATDIFLEDTGAGSGLKRVYIGTDNGNLILGRITDDAWTRSEIMRLTSAGRVGIGTTSPSTKLHVVGQTRSSSFAAANGTANLPAYRFAYDSNVGLFRPGTDMLGFSTGGVERMRIDASGNIGLGSAISSISALLDVGGTLRVRGVSRFLDDVYIQNSSTYPSEMDYGNGSDGDLTVSSAGTVVNRYTFLTSKVDVGDTLLPVGSTSGFSVGDLILIVQMQSYAYPDWVGKYEFNRVAGISGSNIELASPLSRPFTSGTFNSTQAEATQIIRVPQYRNVKIGNGASIVAPAWNGRTGGIVAFKVQYTLTFDGTGKIDVSARGYRGGSCNGCGNNAWGQQGEGITGLGRNSLSRNRNGGGGGYGPSGYGGEPGAGGGCFTAGKDGVSSYISEGGEAVCSADKLIMGGGAGGGGDDDGRTPYPQYVDGGGAVLIAARDIENANIYARGEDGIAPGGPGGATGGGAGGTVKLYFSNYTEKTIDVSGGKGGVDTDDKGGDGGDGLVVKIAYEPTNILFFADVSEGKIGVRTASPQYELDVKGIVRASTFLAYSDKRLKENVSELKDTLSKLSKIRPVAYSFKADKSHKTHLGVMAQDVASVFPELVYKDKNGVLAVDYIGLISPMISSIKELNTKIDSVSSDLQKVLKLKNGVFSPDRVETKHLTSKTVGVENLEVSQNVILPDRIAGRAVIKRGQDRVEVKSDAVSETSVIVVTQVATSPKDKAAFVISQKKGSFMIMLDSKADKDLFFNYVVFNTPNPTNIPVCPKPPEKVKPKPTPSVKPSPSVKPTVLPSGTVSPTPTPGPTSRVQSFLIRPSFLT